MGIGSPVRGEIWLVDFGGRRGHETYKTRPCVVISIDGLGALGLKVVVPFTDWKAHYRKNPWMVKVSPTSTNGLDKDSALDGLQVTCVDETRFTRRLGVLSAGEMEDAVASVRFVIDAI